LAKINVDVNQESSSHYGIQAMPTFHVIDASGQSIHKVTGGSEDNVNKCIEKAKEHKAKHH
jgi:thioredoxin-like negative regulator of GroEL